MKTPKAKPSALKDLHVPAQRVKCNYDDAAKAALYAREYQIAAQEIKEKMVREDKETARFASHVHATGEEETLTDRDRGRIAKAQAKRARRAARA